MVPNNMNESDEHVNLQKTDLWNHQKTALKIRIPEIRRPAFKCSKIAATEMFLAIPIFNKYVCLPSLQFHVKSSFYLCQLHA